jgi:phage terminase large subunit-like protein
VNLSNPFNPATHPNCYEAHEYANDVISGRIPNCKFVVGAVKRYLKDLNNKEATFYFDADFAERYLRLVQKFPHVIGKWDTPNIVYLPWQKWIWINIMGFKNKSTNLRRFRICHVELPRGQGKALDLQTEVPTPDKGIVKFGELKVGDKLYARDGSVCSIVNKNKIHYPDAYRIHFSDGSEVICSGNHLWFTSDKKERDREYDKLNLPYESVKSAEKIFETQKYGDYQSNHRVPTTKPTLGGVKLNHPYYLGYWIGNGRTKGTDLCVHEDHVGEVSKYILEDGVSINRVTKIPGRKAKRIMVSEMGNATSKFVKADKKFIPDSILNTNLKCRKLFLAGLLDSDGTCHIKSGLTSFGTIHLHIAESVKKICCSLGIIATIQREYIGDRNTRSNTQFFYRVSFTSSESYFKLSGKSDRVKPKVRATQKGRYITKVEKLSDKVPMFCIEVDSKDKSFLITNQYIPTHNSAMASQCSLFFLALDNPNGNMIANVATKKDQARIVLDSSRAMAQKSKAFRRETGVEVLAHTILHKKSNSMIRALSSDKNGLDGLNDVLAVCDELHAMNREVFDVIYSGMSKRKDSLTLCITTAGFSVDSVGYSQSSYAKRICEDKIDDDQFFAVVYTIDEGDDIFDEITWKKANPSYGQSVDAVTFEAKAKKAIEQPQDLPNFKVKHLNIWLSEMESFYDVDKLIKCEKPITLEQFKGKKVRIGVDISSHIDLTSLGLIFFEDGNYYMFDKSYIPEASLMVKRNSLYDECVAKGYLIKTKGEAINQEFIEKELKQMCKDFRVLDVCLDPWNSVKLMQDLQKDRVPTTEFRMTVANLSEPMKKMDVLIREEKIFYNGSPLLNWSFGNVVAKIDAANNVFPRKNNEKLKIDPVIALLMSLASWLQSGTEESVYNQRGLRHF